MERAKDEKVILGQIISKDVYDYLLRHFKEAFSHTSLSIEDAFDELSRYTDIIKTTKNEVAYEYSMALDEEEQNRIMKLMHQMIVFKGSCYGVFNDPMSSEEAIEDIYYKYFKYFTPYLFYYVKYDEFGEFDKIATFHNLDTLFLNLPQARRAKETAENMQRDHLNAFDYAMTLDDIGIKETIKINEIVNASNEDINAGFKKTNNDIIGASFTPVDKQNVPVEMQKLFKEYNEGFGMDIKDPTETNITSEERYKRVCTILEREAIFHIRFERIHPFSDGNGRTGRIIMNHNLLKYGIAPVLITNVMSDDYKECINNFDVDGLTKIMLTSTSQQASNWMSLQRATRNEDFVNNDVMAEIVGYDDIDEGVKRRVLAYKNLLVF